MAVKRPLVTIGVTAYNAASSISTAVRSALAQSWRPIEIVIVDDSSNDGTLEIVNELALAHPEIRVFSNRTNIGVSASRNRILAAASGEFVAFFDDDDVSNEHRIQLQFDRIVSYEERWAERAPVICHAARKVIYPGDIARVERTMGEQPDRVAPSGPAVARRILMGEHVRDGYGACPTCSQMARTSTYRSVGGFDPVFRRGEDTDFNVRLALDGGHFVGISTPLVTQTMTPTAEKTLAEQYHYSILLLEKHRTFIESNGNYEFCVRWVKARHDWLSNRRLQFARSLLMLGISHPLLTSRRLLAAMRNSRQNRDFRRFHAGPFGV